MGTSSKDMSGTLVLGRYRIVKPLARGGMGIVYLARTEGAAGFTRPVVIKRVVPDLQADDAAMQAFVREAKILANLQHPSIVNVIDFDEEDDTYVMVLEYVHGYNLGQWHKYVVDTREHMRIDHAVYVMVRVLEALHYAHNFVRSDGIPMQIVHRDVSPGNILIDAQGHVKLLDFGIARANEGGEYRTRDGLFKGKLVYAAPEIYEGMVATPRSDVYSAGVVLYQLLAGENPFRGKDMREIVRRVLTARPAPLAALREDISPELDAVLERTLAKDPASRYPTAAALADALRAVSKITEEDFIREFADEVWNDFNGDMANRLGLEPLQERDAAWRASVGDAGRELRSTPPPPAPDGDPVTRTLVEREMSSQSSGAPVQEARRKGRALLLGGLAAAVVIAIVAVVLVRKPDQAPAARFVVVEKESRSDAPDEAPPSAAPSPPAPAPTEAAPAPSAPAAPQAAVSTSPPGDGSPATTRTAKPDAASLSRTFARQRGRIEGCFREHVKEVDGRPEVGIRFQVGTSGKVESAQLSPASLSATPLGGCLLGVARGTDFGPQSESVGFSIPITARKITQ